LPKVMKVPDMGYVTLCVKEEIIKTHDAQRLRLAAEAAFLLRQTKCS